MTAVRVEWFSSVTRVHIVSTTSPAFPQSMPVFSVRKLTLPDRTSRLIWIQTVWHPNSVHEEIFGKVHFEKKSVDDREILKNYRAGKRAKMLWTFTGFANLASPCPRVPSWKYYWWPNSFQFHYCLTLSPLHTGKKIWANSVDPDELLIYQLDLHVHSQVKILKQNIWA